MRLKNAFSICMCLTIFVTPAFSTVIESDPLRRHLNVPADGYQQITSNSEIGPPLADCKFDDPYRAVEIKRTGFALSQSGAPTYERYEAKIREIHTLIEFFHNGKFLITGRGPNLEDGQMSLILGSEGDWLIEPTSPKDKVALVEQIKKADFPLETEVSPKNSSLTCVLRKESAVEWIENYESSMKEEPFFFFGGIQHGKKATHPAEAAVFITHPHPEFDSTKSTEPNLPAFLSETKKLGFPIFFLAHYKDLKSSYFLKEGDFHFPVASPAGQHQVSLPNAKTIILAGGNLDLCLCNTVRDLLKLSAVNEVNLILATEVTYLNAMPYTGVWGRESSSLSDFFASHSDEKIHEWFKSQFFGTGSPLEIVNPKGEPEKLRYDSGFLCPSQFGRPELSDELNAPLANSGLSLSIFRGRSQIGDHIGTGNKKIKIILARNHEIRNYIEPNNQRYEVAPVKIKRTSGSVKLKPRKLIDF